MGEFAVARFRQTQGAFGGLKYKFLCGETPHSRNTSPYRVDPVVGAGDHVDGWSFASMSSAAVVPSPI